MAHTLRNVIAIGAGGNLGPSVLSALISSPNFNVTVLSRASSQSRFPPHVVVKSIPDSYPLDDLVEAFKGQDAVIDMAPLMNVSDRLRFIDAAVKAGVKRFIPGEFGAKTTEPRVKDAVPLFSAKVEIADYLKSKEATGLTWTGIINGPFFDWGLQVGFLGFDLKELKATIYDAGDVKTDLTLLSTVAEAVVSVLEHPSSTSNQYVFINSFFVSQNEILAALETVSSKKWDITRVTTAEAKRIGTEKLARGDFFGGLAGLLAALEFGADDWAHFYGSDNHRLGLYQNENLETVVGKVYRGEKV